MGFGDLIKKMFVGDSGKTEKPKEEKEGAKTPSPEPEEKPGTLTDRFIVEQISEQLSSGDAVMRIGSTVLVPKYFTIYMSPADFDRFMDKEVVRKTLVGFLKKEIAKILGSMKESGEEISPAEVHISIKEYNQLEPPNIKLQAELEEEEGFREIVVDTPAEQPPAEAPAAAAPPSQEAKKDKRKTQARPPTVQKPEHEPAPLKEEEESQEDGLTTEVQGNAEPPSPDVKVSLRVEGPESRADYELPAFPVTVGRSTGGGFDIVDPTKSVSRKHMSFAFDPEKGVTVALLDSASNATELNGKALVKGTPTPVSDGAVLSVVDVKITVSVEQT